MSLLFYVFLPSFLLACFLIFRVGGPASAYWLSLALLTGGAACLGKKAVLKASRADVLLLLALILFSHVVCYLLFDLWHDGLTYHQPAVSRIAEGFNPVYDGYMNLGYAPGIWSDHATYFPKGTEYFAAAVTAAWGDIQTGKAYTLILIFASIFFALHCTRGESRLKRLLWIAACLNPIALTQFAGYVADGALSSLVLIALLCARGYFSERDSSGAVRSGLVHCAGVVSLALLCCVKTSGLAFAAVIVFCVCLHRLVSSLRPGRGAPAGPAGLRFREGLGRAVLLGLKLGGTAILLAAVLGFAPYVTDLLQGKHMFHSIYGSGKSGDMNDGLGGMAEKLYPAAHNRFTRLFFSAIAYTTFDYHSAAAIKKTPLDAPRSEWEEYAAIGYARGGGFGPLFYLLCVLALVYVLLSYVSAPRGKIEGWLLFTLFLLAAVHPHSWQVRYVPFVWLFPIVLFLSLPAGREYLLLVPLLLLFADAGGVLWIFGRGYCAFSRTIAGDLAPYRGQTVLLDRSVFQADGFFDRFGIRQRFANPEAVELFNMGMNSWKEVPPARRSHRISIGSVLNFKEDLPPLPTFPLRLSEEEAAPWVSMSEGLFLLDKKAMTFEKLTMEQIMRLGKTMPPTFDGVTDGVWNYSPRVKLFTRVWKKPEADMEFFLTGSPRVLGGVLQKRKMAVYVNNKPLGEWLWDEPGPAEKTVTIPLALLEESWNDEMNLLAVRMDLAEPDGVFDPDALLDPRSPLRHSLNFEKIEFRE
ncbi:MAG: hypothetical protein LBO82_10100 [Synergistaceae bacterium]|nr:hypothetical protein [Synergistaceae bacterium]